MADPITIGLMVASQAVQTVGEVRGANAEARGYRENARLTELQGEYDVLGALRKSRMEQGASVADAAASGGSIGSGSVADIIYQNSVERQMEALNIRAGAAGQASGLRSQAAQAKARGRAAIVKGVFRAGAAVLGGIKDQKNQDRLAGQVSTERAGQLQPLGTIPLPSGTVGYGGVIEPPKTSGKWAPLWQ